MRYCKYHSESMKSNHFNPMSSLLREHSELMLNLCTDCLNKNNDFSWLVYDTYHARRTLRTSVAQWGHHSSGKGVGPLWTLSLLTKQWGRFPLNGPTWNTCTFIIIQDSSSRHHMYLERSGLVGSLTYFLRITLLKYKELKKIYI